MPVTEIQDNGHFWNVVAENEVVIVETYAEWDKAAPAYKPLFGKLSEEGDCNKSGIMFMRFNVENLRDLSESLGITAMPTYFAFHKSEQCGKVLGAKPMDVNNLAMDTICRMDE